jgi:hypothetical protein
LYHLVSREPVAQDPCPAGTAALMLEFVNVHDFRVFDE